MTFTGAKLALFLGDKLAVIERDDHPGLPFPGYIDLPGGGREGGESPLTCALRECREELGLDVPPVAILWQRAFESAEGTKWFFVARLPAEAAGAVVFGDEGKRWMLMEQAEFLSHPKAVPDFQVRLRVWLDDCENMPDERPPAT